MRDCRCSAILKRPYSRQSGIEVGVSGSGRLYNIPFPHVTPSGHAVGLAKADPTSQLSH